MGVDSRRDARKGPPLPAPTETDSTAAGTEVDAGTETYSVPDDGRPITVATRRKKHTKDDSSELSHNRSQTSFLIDFFEGGKSPRSESRKPSVRVKVTPSSKSRSKSAHGHIQISEKKGNRKPSYTKRITLEPGPSADGDDTSSIRSAAEESNVTDRSGGIEVEIMGRHGSPLIPEGRGGRYAFAQGSDISSMPADSFLDGKPGTPEHRRSRSTGEVLATGLPTAIRAGQVVEELKTPRRRSSRSHADETLLSPESSVIRSQISSKSAGEQSFRSTTSKSSINNPKLLETVEDAIRRLILPELSQLRREQSKHTHRERERRGSVTSGSAISKDEETKSRRSSVKGPETPPTPRVAHIDDDRSNKSPRPRKERRSKRPSQTASPRALERDSEDTVVEEEVVEKKKSSRAADAAAAAAVTALTASALLSNESTESIEQKKRRKRRDKSRSRQDSLTEDASHAEYLAPPMPLMSEVNASDITRSSIMSANSDRPSSASQEHLQMTPTRETTREAVSPTSRTPTRTPVAVPKGLTIRHSNLSRGNLSMHSQDSEQHTSRDNLDVAADPRHLSHSSLSEHEDVYVEDDPHVAQTTAPAALNGVNMSATSRQAHDDLIHSAQQMTPEQFGYYQNKQVVPPPLKYVPYAEERRGLSPIPSVSGYTEGDPDMAYRHSRSIHSAASFSSLAQSHRPRDSLARSMKSLDSLGDVLRNRHDFTEVRQGGLTDSELTQDGEEWDERHKENGRMSSNLDNKHLSTYTDDSIDVAAGHNVANVAQNPGYVHAPMGVESAVASLINESELTGYSARQDHGARRASFASFEEGSEQCFSSRGNSPVKQFQATPDRRDSMADYEGEYELDDAGRKVTMPNYKKHGKKGGIAAIVSGAAAVVMGKSAKRPRYDAQASDRRDSFESPQQKTFKQRAMEGQIPLSPKHSIDRLSDATSQSNLKMGASGLPDVQHPMPEIGYGDEGSSELTTNPSIIQGPIDSSHPSSRAQWSHSANEAEPKDVLAVKAAEAALLGSAAAAGAAAAVSGHQRQASHEQMDEWRRTSAEQKRDTLVTNPYEGTSPIAALGPGLDNDVLSQPPFHHGAQDYAGTRFAMPTSPGALPKDEGYISSANNARSVGAHTPEPRGKGPAYAQDNLGVPGNDMSAEDAYYGNYDPKHNRHISGMSQGMGSPVYDSATGQGMDRIQSKDIVALMDHVSWRRDGVVETNFLYSLP